MTAKKTTWQLFVAASNGNKKAVSKLTETARDIIQKSELSWPEYDLQIRGTYTGVYVLLNKTSGLHKIGFASSSILNRISHIAGEAGVHRNQLKLIAVIATRNYRDLENCLHGIFWHKQMHGEWFNLDTQDFEYIKSLAEVE